MYVCGLDYSNVSVTPVNSTTEHAARAHVQRTDRVACLMRFYADGSSGAPTCVHSKTPNSCTVPTVGVAARV